MTLSDRVVAALWTLVIFLVIKAILRMSNYGHYAEDF